MRTFLPAFVLLLALLGVGKAFAQPYGVYYPATATTAGVAMRWAKAVGSTATPTGFNRFDGGIQDIALGKTTATSDTNVLVCGMGPDSLRVGHDLTTGYWLATNWQGAGSSTRQGAYVAEFGPSGLPHWSLATAVGNTQTFSIALQPAVWGQRTAVAAGEFVGSASLYFDGLRAVANYSMGSSNPATWIEKVHMPTGGAAYWERIGVPAAFDAAQGVQAIAYPNPTTGALGVLANVPMTALALSDLAGRVVLTQTVSSIQATVPMETLAPGVYLLHVHTEGRQVVLKVVKQ